MVIIRVNCNLSPEHARIVTEGILAQAPGGKIVMPNFCEVVAEVPDGEEIQVYYRDARVAELEAELAKVKNRRSDCETCGKAPTCYHNAGRSGMVRINCPLWRPKG